MILQADSLPKLYGDQLEHEYHQDHRGGLAQWLESPSIVVASVALICGLLYTLLHTLDYDLLSLPELLWNILVFLTPSRLLDVLDHDVKFTSPMNPGLRSKSETHAAKSELLRKLLGFDKASGIVNTVAQAGRRRLSSFSSINMGLQRDDERPPGLGNWDNSCYQNSVLQGLASLEPLPRYLEDSSFEGEQDDPELKMSYSLRGLIEQLTDPANNGLRIWTPPTLKSMSSWQQQDAQEYFSKVLDEIDREITKASIKKKSVKGLEMDDVPVRNNEDLTQVEAQGLHPATTTRNPLEGLLAQRVGCTRCGYSEGLSMIPFNCLTVPLGKAWSYDLSECLDEYTQLESIEGVECGKCTLLKTQNLLKLILDRAKESPEDDPVRISTLARLQIVSDALENDDYDDKTLTQKCKIPPKNRVNTVKSRQAVVARPPKSLVIHVNRSVFDEMTGELRKNYAEVRFPRTLDLGRWCLGSAGTPAEEDQYEEWKLDPGQSMIAGKGGLSRIYGPVYDLRAVVTHYGRHENGHYIAYRKHLTPNSRDEKGTTQDQWWRLSDDDVMKVTEENVLGQGGVFMLFYDCIHPPQLDIPSDPLVPNGSLSAQTTELVIASEVPLPADSEDDFENPDSDDQDAEQMSPEPSSTTSISEDEVVSDLQDYHPTKPIRIPKYMPNNGSHLLNGKEGKKQHVGPRGMNMVMV